MSNVDWTAIRADYEGGLSLRALAAKYSMSKSVIGERKYREKWKEPERTRRTDTRTVNSNPNGTTYDVNASVRVHTALRILLEERPSWDEIAARSGYNSRGACYNAVKRELQRRITHNIEELREQELYQLEQLQAKCYKEATDKGNQYWSFAIDRFVSLSERKAKLMGMDTPTGDIVGNATIIRQYDVEVGSV